MSYLLRPRRRAQSQCGIRAALALALAILCALACPACKDEEWTVERVVDGDTLIATRGSRRERVRLKGVDAPEIPRPERNQFRGEPFGEESSECLRRMAEGRSVTLRPPAAGEQLERDKYGRLLAYVYVEQTLVNAALVEQGCARSYNRFPHPLLGRFKELEAGAREAGLGIWAPGDPTPIIEEGGLRKRNRRGR